MPIPYERGKSMSSMSQQRKPLRLFLFGIVFLAAAVMCHTSAAAQDNGLLFYLSGQNGLDADFANGDPVPNYISGIDIVSDGARGPGFRCADTQLMAYEAPGNIYAERGTLSFFWRSRHNIGETPFPIFRVSHADHSSWDLVWLRVDWNGSGFEAFVTDVNLARERVKYTVPETPPADKWNHIAVSWDETKGIRLYVDGRQVAKEDTVAVLYAGLDQFGPHSRIISPYQVQSLYNYVRGGDVDEIAIFDHMLTDDEIGRLAAKADPKTVTGPAPERNLTDPAWRAEWLLRNGWNRPGDLPPYLDAPSTRVRRIGITEAYDVKQWTYKGIDGIRETTWPYVYNFSRIPGRMDYFVLPDWNCYSISGKNVTFTMPDEPWNHIEIAGAAFGVLSHLHPDKHNTEQVETVVATRPAGQERTFHYLSEPRLGGKIRFENDQYETPIGEFMVYSVAPGLEPAGTVSLSYTVDAGIAADNPSLSDLVSFIDGRYMPDERQTAVALPSGSLRKRADGRMSNPLPFVHVLIPFEFRAGKADGAYTRFSYTWENMRDGLDGIAIDIPALDVQPLADGLYPLNIRVMDPIWPARALFDFSFSVKPGEPRTVWMDTRDRILPNGYSLYLTFAGAAGLTPEKLDGARIRLIFKDRDTVRVEHETDRFMAIRDNLANMVEEGPNQKKLKMYNRFSEDMTDLFRVNPDHYLGRIHWAHMNREQGYPPFIQPEPPSGVPLWAFRQVECMKILDQIYTWWIDKRQIDNGEFGGGLSDDGDMTNQFVGPALMGMMPDKFASSLHKLLEAYYDQGLFTNGISTIVTDELHTYEEGICVQPQVMLLDYGDPKTVERMMETANAYDFITGINDRGERMIKSIFFGGEKVFSEGVWAQAKGYSYLIFHPGLSLVEFNGHPETKKLILEVADGLLAHRKKDANGNWYMPYQIMFPGGEESGRGLGAAKDLFWAAYRWTGDEKYLLPISDDANRGSFGSLSGLNANLIDHIGKRDTWGKRIAASTSPRSGNTLNRHIAWQVTGNKQYLEEYYGDLVQSGTQRLYLNTEGHWWIDRIYGESREIQRSRLGGIALWRNNLYPGHYVSWRFHKPATYQSAAILIPDATPEKMTIIAFNLDRTSVTADLTGWNVDPGEWEVTQGIDSDGDDKADTAITKKRIPFERTKSFEVVLPGRRTSVLTLERKKKGADYWRRPDLGISGDDIRVSGASVAVTVHSLGSVDTPAAKIVLRNASGATVATADIPALKAPLDYMPKTAEVTLSVRAGTKLEGCSVVIDPDSAMREITVMNNTVVIR